MPTELFLDASDPSLQGLYRRANGSLSALTPNFLRNDVLPRRIHVMEETVATAIERLRHRVIAGATLKVGIGSPDLGPSGGTFALTFSGNGTGMTALAWNITAAALSTAMNNNTPVGVAGGCDVTGTAPTFIVTFRTVGDKAQFGYDAASLEPSCTIDIQTTQNGTASIHEEQVIRLLRRPYAYSSNWSVVSDSSTATATLSPTGSSTTKGVVDLVIPETAESGSFRLEFSRVQVWTATAKKNVNPLAQRFFITVATPTAAGDYNNVFFDVEDSAGPVRMWMNYNATGTAPTVPTGGRNLAIAYNSGVASTIATSIKTALAADAQFSGTQMFTGAVVLAVQTTPGTRVTPVPTVQGAAGSSALLTLAVETAGTNGSLGGTFFPLADNAGTVAVWFNVHNDAEPSHGANRSIEVNASAFTTATIAATGIAAALDADAAFVSTSSGAYVTVTDAVAGARSIGSVTNTAGIAVAITTAGVGIADEFSFDATTTDLEATFGASWLITPTKPRQFRFVAKTNGTWSAPTITSNFVVPTYFDGTITLATTTLHSAFGATTDETLAAVLEVEYTTPAGAVETILRMPVVLYRDLLDAATIGPVATEAYLIGSTAVNFLSGVTGYIGGGATNLDGVTTVGVSVPRLYIFRHATDGARIYILRSGTDAEASPDVIRPDDYAATTNEKVWESVG